MPDSAPSPGMLQKLIAMLVPSTQQIAAQNPVDPNTGLSAAQPSPGLMQRMMGNSQPAPAAQPTTQVPTPGTPEYYEYMQKRPLGTQGVKRSMFDFLGR